MSDSVTKWYEMQQEEKAKTVHSHAYVWVLDLEAVSYTHLTLPTKRIV